MRAVLVVLLPLSLTMGCPDRHSAPPPSQQEEEVPPRPRVDEAFARRAFSAEAMPANEALVMDLDPLPGEEAIVVVDLGNRNYQVAVVRGNHRVITRAPLGGKILAHTNVQRIGAFRRLKADDKALPMILLPVATLVFKQWVCGILVFRYRSETLVLVGELGSRCWNKEAGIKVEVDPYSLLKEANQDGELRLEMSEDNGTRLYRWDKILGSFLSMAFKK